MRKKKIPTILICLLLVFCCLCPNAYALEAPEVTAAAVVLADMNSGNILYEENMNDVRPPASLTKIVTGLLAVEAIEKGIVSEDDVITAPSDCQQGLDVESSTADPIIQAGEQMTYIDLVYCALLHSANEACNVIAVTVSGSISNFVDEMNLKARELGAKNTMFYDTNGLLETNDSSAYDLFLITREAMNHPLFATIVNTESYTVPPTNMCSEERVLKNSNALLTSSSMYGSAYRYEGVYGVKTGYTRAAGYCLVSACQKEGKNLLCIVLGCNGWLNTGDSDYGNFSGTIKLYNWAFENFEYKTLITNGTAMKTVTIENAPEGENRLVLLSGEGLRLLLPVDLDESDITTQISLYEEKLVAPISAGDTIGQANILVNGSLYASVPLLAKDSIQEAKKGLFKLDIGNGISEFFQKPAAVVLLFALILLAAGCFALMQYYKAARRKHLRERRIAEKRRMEARKNKDGQNAQATSVSWQTAFSEQETPLQVKSLDPSDRASVETDLDQLIKSLGLDK